MNRKNLFLLTLFSCLLISNTNNAKSTLEPNDFSAAYMAAGGLCAFGAGFLTKYIFSKGCKHCSKDPYTCPNPNHNIKEFPNVQIIRSVPVSVGDRQFRMKVIIEVRDGKVVEAYDQYERPLTRDFLREQLEIEDKLVNDAYNCRFYYNRSKLLRIGSNAQRC